MLVHFEVIVKIAAQRKIQISRDEHQKNSEKDRTIPNKPEIICFLFTVAVTFLSFFERISSAKNLPFLPGK